MPLKDIMLFMFTVVGMAAAVIIVASILMLLFVHLLHLII
jgi:hypothetical protein